MQGLVAAAGKIAMLNKEDLRADFSKKPKEYYSVKLFEDQGFERKKCSQCDKFFWTTDPERVLCGDSAHEPYSFIKEKQKTVEYVEFWNRFATFFKKNGHEVIEKYPVVSRWRQDLYFTIASIQDFQRIEGGRIAFEYGANPLIVPQICMRFNDIPNVGLTGRHLTSFMMAGQHAFNYPKEGYWRDRTIELNYKFLTEELGVKKKDLTYIEDVWAMGDFSEFGPCLEFFSNGLELGNNVFTQFEYTNGQVKELDGKVVDVGWGWERQPWFYTGTDTMYDAIFRKQLEFIHKSGGTKPDTKMYSKVAGMFGTIDATETKDFAKVEKQIIKKSGISEKDYFATIKPMQVAYAIADHTRSLLFGITDGALPSNVGGGYNLRIILRRIFDFVEEHNIGIDLMKVMEMHAKDLKPLYGDIDTSLDEIARVLDVEKRRYQNTKESAGRILNQIIERKEKLTDEKVRTLYESNGITPEFIRSTAAKKGIDLDVSDEAYNSIVKGNFVAKQKKQHDMGIDTSKLEKTEKLYYKGNATEAEAKAVKIEGNMVVLDKTPFYPEGGGQESDHGTINGIRVKEAQSISGVIVHALESKPTFKEGAKVKCAVDQERRKRLVAHHTATHLISAAARAVLGKHAWQEGAHKGADKAHIDVAHYEKLNDEQVRQIENRANEYVLNGIKVSINEMNRADAEAKFGFSIYQGHGVPASRIRIVEVRDLKGKLIDAEACGGLHIAGMESTVGIIKIISTARISDGINRIEFTAGEASKERINQMEGEIDSLVRAAGIDRDKLHTGLSAKLDELKKYRESYGAASDELASYISATLAGSKEKTISFAVTYDRAMMRKIATLTTEKKPEAVVIILNEATGEAVCIAGPKSGKKAIDEAKAYAKRNKKEFKGGGAEKIAEGKLS
jgi:alanyl-tRNA synthetase